MKLILKEQVGHAGTHVYHGGNDVHEHHPLSPGVEQISRGDYKRPDRNKTQETNENPQTENQYDKLENVKENNNNAEIQNDSNVILTPNIDKNDADSQNSSSKETNDGNKNEHLNKNETDKVPISNEKEEANKIEKPNENTSTQNNTINEINNDVPKIIDNNGSVGADISPELEHGQIQKVYENYPPAYKAITGKKYNGSINENSTNTLEHGQSQEIYETYPKAYEAKTGKKFNKTQTAEKRNTEINSLNNGERNNEVNSSNIIHKIYIRNNINNSENEPNENNNNSVTGKAESENDKNKLYDNYLDAFEGITGKTYNGSRENNSTIQLEHGQTQNIYETYPEAYEAKTGEKFNKTQSDEKRNTEINSLNIDKNDDKTDNLNNSQTKSNEYNNNSVDVNIESEDGRNKLYDNYPDAFEGITGKTYNGLRESNFTNQLEHGHNKKIYETYPEAYEVITGKKYNGSQHAENDKSNKELISTNANSADNTPGGTSPENQSIVSQENSSVPSRNEPSISDNNGGNHESTEGVKQFILNGGTSIIIQVGNNCNCNQIYIDCNGQAQNIASSTTNVNNGTPSNKPSRGIQIIVNAIGKGNPANVTGYRDKISVIAGSSKHQPAKQIPRSSVTSVKNLLLSQFKVKRCLQAA